MHAAGDIDDGDIGCESLLTVRCFLALISTLLMVIQSPTAELQPVK